MQILLKIRIRNVFPFSFVVVANNTDLIFAIKKSVSYIAAEKKLMKMPMQILLKIRIRNVFPFSFVVVANKKQARQNKINAKIPE